MRARARIDAELELEQMWRHGLVVDAAQITDGIIAEVSAEWYGMLWALLLSLVAGRIDARHFQTGSSCGRSRHFPGSARERQSSSAITSV
jgi:hypothetical protein